MKVYERGLRFECRRCGQCCVSTREDMGVYLYLSDIARISESLGLTKESFAAKYCFFRQRRPGPEAIQRIQVKKRKDGACVFLKEGRCEIYRMRPVLCRFGPFARSLMESPESFRLFRAICRGIDSGRLYPEEEIRRCLRRESRLEEQYQIDLAADLFLNTIFYSSRSNSNKPVSRGAAS